MGYLSGNMGVAFLAAIPYLLSIVILYLTTKMVHKGVSFYESLASYNWSIFLTFIFFIILGFMMAGSVPRGGDINSLSGWAGSIGWFWISLMMLFPLIILAFSISFVMGLSWFPSIFIAVLSTIVSYVFFYIFGIFLSESLLRLFLT